ncbi:BQ5605_C003g01938 [Microbotryum silenes-dioicae]|uniref:BQ5605_C003g01938 protein n=1 Tax=Microbotryum silenes-dioicae TaxID=796604 RepID=A0A2X0M069_9BASI|nr:BQ5605_C003g01938 [Microbotryum silenes-dioicae]
MHGLAAAVLVATTLLQLCSALPSTSSSFPSSRAEADLHPSPYDTTAYMAFPARTAPVEHAFMSPQTPLVDPGTIPAALRSKRPKLLDPDTAQSPAFAWDRHPLGKRRAGLDPLEQFNVGRLSKRAAIASSNAPFPASTYINVNNLTSIALVAQAAVARMQTWYEDGVFDWTGWWQTPVLGLAYTQLDLALGNNVNELLIKDLLIKNDDKGWMIDAYVDDQSAFPVPIGATFCSLTICPECNNPPGWWAMFALRAHQAYPNQTWFQMVQTINNNNTLYWTDTCGGGVLWLTYRPMIKNTITNGLYFSILTRLYRYTGNSTYFDYSMNTLNWWLGWGFDADNGRVWDTITGPGCDKTGEASWTYNSGAFLYGLADLWYATGDERILDLGRTIAYAGIRDFTEASTGVLVESCEHDAPPSAGKPPGCQQDETVFKGIFILALAELYLARPDPNIYNFINTQMLSNVFNNVDNSWLFGMWWNGPWNETTAGPKTQITALCALAAAATVNADYLAHAGADTTVAPMYQVAVPDNTSRSTNAGSTVHETGVHTSASATIKHLGPFAVAVLAFVVGVAVLV